MRPILHLIGLDEVAAGVFEQHDRDGPHDGRLAPEDHTQRFHPLVLGLDVHLEGGEGDGACRPGRPWKLTRNSRGIESASDQGMARALWKGTLGFGLVSIPVELHTAVKDLGPHFNFLRRSDKSRISFQKVSKKDGELVPADQLVKGYEYEKGRYVILDQEDFDQAAVKRDSRIELLDFVGTDEVDDRYFDKPYYLLPAKGGEQPYALLREALRKAGRVGIAKFVLRNQPHLAAVEVVKQALVLSTMRFREEVIPVKEYKFPEGKFREQELRMATQLIDALVAEWDPDKYTDDTART